jgi:predicted DNA-binding protein YlxM (UPF0122 family)/predicted RNA-binding protein YlqC (UPF0109 family)
MEENQVNQQVDNSINQSVEPEPLQHSTQQTEPGARNIDVLTALLDGADPDTLFKTDETSPPEETGQGEPEKLVQPPFDFEVPDKFKNPDNSINIEAALKSYLEAEKVIGIQGNTIGELRQILDNIYKNNSLQQAQQENLLPPEVEEVESPSLFPWEEGYPEDQKEALLDKYYNDPLGIQAEIAKTMEERINATIEQALKPFAPIIENYQRQQSMNEYQRQMNEYQRQMNEFIEAGHSDFQEYQPAMMEIANKLGEKVFSLPNPIETLYWIAKGQGAGQVQKPPTLEEMLANQETKEKIVGDQGIKNEVLKNYAQEVAQKKTPPVVIGSQAGTSTPATPGERPRSVREASSMFRRFLNQEAR